jgi:Rieske 2Fe-2S family protein
MLVTSKDKAAGYTGLTELTEGLPAETYFDPRHYERELRRIWHRNWIYVCRSAELSARRAFRTFELGDQKILLVRDDDGSLTGRCYAAKRTGSSNRRPSSARITPGLTI